MKNKSAGIRRLIRGMERSALLSVICLAFAVAYPTAAFFGNGVLALIFRLMAGLAFVAVGVTSYIMGAKDGVYGKLVIAGLALSAIAGICLEIGAEWNTAVGIGIYVLGNIMYISALACVNGFMPFQAAAGALFGGAAAFYIWKAPWLAAGRLYPLAALYSFITAFMVGGALCAAVRKKRERLSELLFASGTVLLAAGSVVSLHIFFTDSGEMDAWNYAASLLHCPGQICIGLSLMDEPAMR